ncbi:aryl-sulfate sulfotransferase [Brachyspira pilosicoli]|uniref:aryl-sulfate sulfotransferase n=1 Tax=Brachyspira pilosicoli TaxID=52584 RepID=UPI001C6870A4|nr:aryl-sulfate sulfotransferase [Brachyspira pilosicoli]MBW5397957.1 aryl sulfotransferase [Brachyspira pilosicoli]
MRKILLIILLITSLFALSCKNNSSSSIGRIGEIVVNPYGVTPLSAVYTTETVNALPITVTVKGLYGEPDIIHTYPSGYGMEFEIHGMFPESDNVIEINDGGRIITKNVSVGSLSYNGINIQKKYDVAINNLPEEKYKNNPELYFFLNPMEEFDIGISRNGYTRYLKTGYSGSKFYIENKRIVLFPNYSAKNSDLLGNVLVQYPSVSHHDAIKINSNYIYLSYSTMGWEDRLIEINRVGTKLRDLSFGKLIQNSLDFKTYPGDESIFKKIVFGEEVNNIYKDNNGNERWVDWFHVNSLVYDSSEDILYVSSRKRAVLAIDYSEWKLIWWMADNSLKLKIDVTLTASDGLPYDYHFKDLKSLEAYRVKGAGIYDGPKNQHALFLLANGNLGMFDNQGDEDSNPNGSRYVEYKITGTHGNYTAIKVYEYKDSSFYSRTMSDVDFTGENYQNILLCYANLGIILEVGKNSKKELFKLDLPFDVYRGDKMPLYYDEGRVYSEDCNLKNPN